MERSPGAHLSDDTDLSDVRLLEAVADPTRLSILRQLSSAGPMHARELTGGRAISQSTASHHLRVLREAGWIDGERQGTFIRYAIRPEAVQRLRAIAVGIEASPPTRGERRASETGGQTRGIGRPQPAWRQW